MRNPKRFIALILVVMMAFGGVMMNVSAVATLTDADQYTTKGALTGVDLAYAIDILQQLGVVRGVSEVLDEDGNIEEYTFDGESLVTRQQFALFTARISTALPGLFVIDPDEEVKSTTSFKDLVDPTYTLAIDHCFGEGYIVGRDDEGTIFDPTGNITFAEAVTMLTRALQYTGLVYPTGFMTRAAEEDVALYGEYADFPMTTVALNTPITRAQMAMLLWNYLLSYKWEVTLVLNFELNPAGEWLPGRVLVPVIEKFGIIRTVGYVTAVPNWSATLDVPGMYRNIVYDEYPISITGGGLSAANTPFQVYRDICISTASLERTSSALSGYQYVGTNIVTTMDKIGLAEYKDDPLYLLGLKVVVYEDKRANRAYDINIPAIVNGKKYEIDIEEADGTNNAADGNVVTSLSLPYPPLGEEAVIDWGNFIARRYPNLYMFGEADAVMRSIAIGDRQADTIYLAQKANNKTNYRLELVDNGYLRDGTPEYFYIFRPFKVGVVIADDAGNRRLTTHVKATANADTTGRLVANAANFYDEDIEAVDVAKGYLYTYYGANFDVYAELDENVEATVTAANYNSGRVDFSLAAGAKSVLFNNGDPKAQGAWPGVVNAEDRNGITRKDIDNKGVYTIYYDGAAALLARKTGGGESYKKSQYAVVMSVSDTREITLRDPNTLERIGQAYRVVAFNAQTGKEETIAMWKVDNKEDNFARSYLDTLIGKPIRLAFAGANNDYWNVYTQEDANFVYVPITGDPNTEYKAANDALSTVGNYSFNSANRRFTVKDDAAKNANHIATGLNAISYINSNTIIVIYSQSGTNPAKITRLAVTNDNLKEFEDILTKTAAASTTKANLALVGLGGNSQTGVAGYVFLKTEEDIKVASTNKYAISLGDAGIYYNGYYYGSVKQMDGSVLNVYAETSAALAKGTLVLLGSNTVEYDGVTYTSVKYADNKLAIGTSVAAFNAVAVASPTSLRAIDGVVYESTSVIDDYVNGYAIQLKSVTPAYFAYLDEFKGEVKVFMKYNTLSTLDADGAIIANTSEVVVTDVWTDAAAVPQQFITLTDNEFYKLTNGDSAAAAVYAVVYVVDDGKGTGDYAAVAVGILIDYTNKNEVPLANLYALFRD